MVRLQPDRNRRLSHPLFNLGGGKAHICRAKRDVLIDRLLEELVFRILEHQPHLEPVGAAVGAVRPEVGAVDEDSPRGGFEQSVEMLDQGAFARTGMPDHPDKLPLLDLEVDILDRRFFKRGVGGINIGQIFGLDRIHPATSKSCAIACAHSSS